MAYIWLKAGISKLGSKTETIQSVQGYEIFSDKWAHIIGSIMAPLEIAGGLLLLFGVFLRASSWLATVVLTLFIVGIAQAWIRGLQIDCGCFGPADPETLGMDYLKTILRDVFYIALTLWTAFRPFKKFALYP